MYDAKTRFVSFVPSFRGFRDPFFGFAGHAHFDGIVFKASV